MKKYFLGLLVALSFIGCDEDSRTTNLNGVFVDSPVVNLKYKINGNGEFFTDLNGKFTYGSAGDVCEFFIGDLSLGSHECKEFVTVFDIVPNTLDSNMENRVKNIASLLQSFDDGSNADKITIPTNISKNLIIDADIDLDTTYSASDIQTIVDNKEVSYPELTTVTVIEPNTALETMTTYLAENYNTFIDLPNFNGEVTISENVAGEVLIDFSDVSDLTISISGTDTEIFTVDSNNKITFGPLNYETQQTYNATISLSSSNGYFITKDITISLTDVLESVVNLASNGVTAVCPGAAAGEYSGEDTYNGETWYVAADLADLTSKTYANTYASNRICTSLVTSLQNYSSDSPSATPPLLDDDVSNWDVSNVVNMNSTFAGLLGPTTLDLSNWDVSGVIDMSYMFENRTASFTGLSNWDVSSVTNMSFMFRGSSFNEDINSWDVSNVTNMSSMFNSTLFNYNIGSWDVSNVTNMQSMFSNTSVFNQDITDWDVSNVSNLTYMFVDTSAFNQDIRNWNFLPGADLTGMFSNSTAFSHDLSEIDFSGVTITNILLDSTLYNTSFDPNNTDEIQSHPNGVTIVCKNATPGTVVSNVLSPSGNFYIPVDKNDLLNNMLNGDQHLNGSYAPDSICTSHLTDLSNVFDSEGTTTPAVASWDVSNVTNFSNMFVNVSVLLDNLSNWNTSSATDMSGLFSNLGTTLDATSFTNWNTSNVTNMSSMFLNTVTSPTCFGETWDVSSVTNMSSMFEGSSVSNCNFSNWEISNVSSFSSMFKNSAFSGSLLWSNSSSVTNVSSMFEGNTNFNNTIELDTSNVSNFTSMFNGATSFNQDITGWDTGNGNLFDTMFFNATAFSQDLSNWDVTYASSSTDFATGSAIDGQVLLLPTFP